MDAVTPGLLLDGVVAGGIGLIVGLEREYSDGEATHDHSEDHLGVRTFAILALFGWICAVLGAAQPWLPPAGLVVAAGLIAAHYLRVGDKDLGLTTEIAAITTCALGMLAHAQRDLAVAAGLSVTLLLIAKPWFRRAIPRLRRAELLSTVQLAIVFAVVLPVLPVEARDPWGVLSPRKIGLFVVLIAGLGFVGYVAHRLLGASRGAGVTGVLGGLVSSTAVTAAMAQQSRGDERLRLPGQISTFLASTVMFARVLVVTLFLDRQVAATLAAPLGLMGVVTLGGAGWKQLELRRAGTRPADPGEAVPLANPFALVPALTWGAVLCAVLVGMAVAKQYLGAQGLYVAAAAAGLADVDAVTIAASRQSHDGALAAASAALAITIAVVSNTIVKGSMALVMGRAGYGRPIAAVFAVAIVVGVLVAILM